jgi:mannosyl-3-phosphoglycerate phosphatase family protein
LTRPRADPAPSIVVFTDLDGTLLEPDTYSPDKARAALGLLSRAGIPVVFCSSKTAAEQRALRRRLGMDTTPFIVENGSAIIVPDAADLETGLWPGIGGGQRAFVLGKPALEVRAGIRRAALVAGITVTGYADITVEQIAHVTGLEPAAAELAMQREYSETLVDRHSADEWRALENALAAEGLRSVGGGRFRTVTSVSADKGSAVGILARLYSIRAGRPVRTVAMGDSRNDIPMLAAVDRAYLIGGDAAVAAAEIEALRFVGVPGPRGWSEAVRHLLGDPGDLSGS